MQRMVLVPLDGSRMAEQALPVAASIARRSGAALHLVTVHVPLAALIAPAEEPAIDGELECEIRAHADRYVASTADAIATAHGLDVTFAVLDGSPAKALAEHAHAKHVGLIVMTTHGHGGMSRLWLGSVADGLLRRAKTPVLVLHPDGTPHAEFHHIVVALDGSIESERALEPAIALGTLARGARYTLVQVVESPVLIITRLAMHPAHMRPHWQQLRENAARSYLERLAEGLRKRDLAVKTEVLSARGIGEQIVNFAQTAGADLIAVCTHGARGVERLLLGSVADKIIRSATQAVLVVPARAEQP